MGAPDEGGKGRRKGRRKGGSERRAPSANTAFEMAIRKNVPVKLVDSKGVEKTIRLDPYGLHVWYWTAQTSPRADGQQRYVMAAEKTQAEQLGISVRQVQINKRAMLANGLFRKKGGKAAKGVHRPPHYERVYLDDETPDEFVSRMQTHVDMDVCVGLHWIACEVTKATGTGEFAAAGVFERKVSKEALRQARRKMELLGHFTVKDLKKQGALYTHSTVAVQSVQVKTGDDDPGVDTAEAALADEHLRDLAFEYGVDLDGKPWTPYRHTGPIPPMPDDLESPKHAFASPQEAARYERQRLKREEVRRREMQRQERQRQNQSRRR